MLCGDMKCADWAPFDLISLMLCDELRCVSRDYLGVAAASSAGVEV